MKIYKIALGIASTLAVGFLVYQVRKSSCEKKLLNISDAGYETAFDILYPQRLNGIKRTDLVSSFLASIILLYNQQILSIE